MGRIPPPARARRSKYVCPICGRFLFYADSRYRCSLHGHYSREQLEDKDFLSALRGLSDDRGIVNK